MNHQPLPRDIRRISVVRAGGLGDLLMTLPAIEALAHTFPDAEVTLCGSPIAERLLGHRPGAPHRVLTLPRIAGVGEPADATSDTPAIEEFLAARRAEGIDLAVQLHGGGRYSNPLVKAFGAGVTIGTKTPDAAPLDRTIDYVYMQHEVVRWLEVVSLVGAAAKRWDPRIELTSEEWHVGHQWMTGARPCIVVHPGATDPRRRWPVERFAEVIAHLAKSGVRCLIIGDAREIGLCARLEELSKHLGGARDHENIVNTSGSLSLTELVGVLGTADLFIGNDSGPRHLAQAVGTATVAVYWIGNVLNAGPLWREKHRVHAAWVTRCPTCGVDVTAVGWTAERCEHDDSFVDEVTVEAVLTDVQHLLAKR